MNRTDVIKLMAHLVITIAVIAAYLCLILTGHKEEAGAFQNMLVLTLGYWFGAVTLNNLGKGSSNDISK